MSREGLKLGKVSDLVRARFMHDMWLWAIIAPLVVVLLIVLILKLSKR